MTGVLLACEQAYQWATVKKKKPIHLALCMRVLYVCVRVRNLDGLNDFGVFVFFSSVLVIGSSLYRVGSATATESGTVLQVRDLA